MSEYVAVRSKAGFRFSGVGALRRSRLRRCHRDSVLGADLEASVHKGRSKAERREQRN